MSPLPSLLRAVRSARYAALRGAAHVVLWGAGAAVGHWLLHLAGLGG